MIFSMRIKRLSEVMGAKVYTDSGDYFGEIEESNLDGNKVEGWRIRVLGSMLSLISGARGVIIPHQFLKAINDIFIISKSALPTPESDIEEVFEETV